MKRLPFMLLLFGATSLVAAPTVSPAIAVPFASSSSCRPHIVYADESWRLGDFTAPSRTTIVDVTFIDVNHDGSPDLFVTEGTTNLNQRQPHLLMNDGHGHFRDETAERLPQVEFNSTRVAWGDLDRNGSPDALISGIGSTGALLLLNDGHGYFRNASDQLPYEPPTDGPDAVVGTNVTLTDVDRDGDLDAMISNENPFDSHTDTGGQNWLWINDGHGHFTDQTAERMPQRKDQTSGILAADLTRDGYPDLIVLNRGQKRVQINDGHGYFRDETDSRFPVTDDSTRDGVLTSLDWHGGLDLLLSNSRHDPLTYYQNDGTGHFTAVPLGIAQNTNETDTAIQGFRLAGKQVFYQANAGETIDFGHDFTGGPGRLFVSDGRGHLTDETAQYLPSQANDPTFSLDVGDINHSGSPSLILGNGADQVPLVDGHYLRLYVPHLAFC